MAWFDYFLTKIKGFSKEEQTEIIQEYFKDWPEFFPMLKQILNKEVHDLNDLKRLFNLWETKFPQRQVRNHSLKLHPPPFTGGPYIVRILCSQGIILLQKLY